jgi:hypothetical protein
MCGGQKGATNAGELQAKVAQKQRVTLKTFMDQNNPPGAQYMYGNPLSIGLHLW